MSELEFPLSPFPTEAWKYSRLKQLSELLKLHPTLNQKASEALRAEAMKNLGKSKTLWSARKRFFSSALENEEALASWTNSSSRTEGTLSLSGFEWGGVFDQLLLQGSPSLETWVLKDGEELELIRNSGETAEVSSSSKDGVWNSSAARIHVASGAKARLVVRGKSSINSQNLIKSVPGSAQGENASLENIGLFLELEEGASLEILNLISSNFGIGISRFWCRLQGNSCLNLVSAHANPKWWRSETHLKLLGPGSNANLLSLGVLGNDHHLEDQAWIDHVVGGSQSQQLSKLIVSHEAKAIFQGRVRIRPGAVGANSDQLNQNLLMSSRAEVDSEPQLQIETDDVKATHGCTVGELSEEEVFYLQSRGLHRNLAERLLSLGFLQGDLSEKIPANWRSELRFVFENQQHLMRKEE